MAASASPAPFLAGADVPLGPTLSDTAQPMSTDAPIALNAFHNRHRHLHATVDDRFTFPPIPGYTGNIPRSRLHFGQSYARTTRAALQSFESLCASKARLPPKVDALLQAQAPHELVRRARAGTGGAPSPSGIDATATDPPAWLHAVAAVRGEKDDQVLPARVKVDGARAHALTGHRATVAKKRDRARELQEQCTPDHKYLPGQTAFVPRERARFGEQYPHSTAAALAEFRVRDRHHRATVRELEALAEHGTPDAADPAWRIYGSRGLPPPVTHRPGGGASKKRSGEYIEGYTGYLSKHLDHVDARGGPIGAYVTLPRDLGAPPPAPVQVPENGMIAKDLAETRPIPGYKGFLPLYQMCGERGFGVSAGQCIDEFKAMVEGQHAVQDAQVARQMAQRCAAAGGYVCGAGTAVAGEEGDEEEGDVEGGVDKDW
ncbi:hypothetical protein AMAG_16278 [Allomyces macrogynus ATCC 38327]|uniref:Uncharacterized protein n=1 Tax=Allomyces macrogynus (strain ATCC 38327) TaxID=578462 RepID=A0A0L0TB83_ALLM3|nr:hypothetical protein AMAG_16278 [Allomyces macrogynus ATCC 38327]|eukprot:KNE71849.1 hypothetical protein AMAG_16278 [Allomyces macrogynus ATCC 38327]